MTTLSELVDRPPVSLEPHESLARAAKRMYEHRIGSVLVLHDDGNVLGIFTERDLLRACAAGVDTHASTVGHWMTENPITAADTTDADEAMHVMIDNDFRHLPVLGATGLLGVVSMRSLSRALAQERSAARGRAARDGS